MDKYPICKICGDVGVEPSHFWREHHVKEADYCRSHYPRVSKLTGESIVFKNRNQYFEADFNNKNELKKWVKDNPDQALSYCLSIIEKRLASGKCVYAPSQVETRSLCMPSVIWYQGACNYNNECEVMGAKSRFKYVDIPPIKRRTNIPFDIDTREQKPLEFALSKRVTLNYADYASSSNTRVFVERKSLPDFISTLSSGYDRFQREILRAAKDGNYIFIAVEESLTSALSFEYLPHISRKIKASSDFIFHRVRDLMQAHPNIQFVFADNRKHLMKLVEAVYSTKTPELYDWQFLLDSKKLIL